MIPAQKRAVRFAAAITAGAVLALGIASGASAASPALIDNTKTGSITVHKFEKPGTPTGLPANGTEQVVPASVKPLAGVTYSAKQLSGYDLTKAADWTALKALTVTTALTAPGSAPITRTTGANGIAAFTGLPLGVYLMQETNYPVGVTPAAPFLLTVPMTDPVKRDAWMYDVHVYPKSSVVGTSEKTVDDSKVQKVGDPVTFTILGNIPTDDVIDGYQIVDPLDSRLTHVSTTVGFDKVGAPTLVKDTDYTLTTAGTPTTVTVRFLAPGLLKLAANNTAHVKVTIATTINAVGDGKIKNQALVFPNLASINATPGDPANPNKPVPTETAETRLGSVTIEKISSKDAQVKLQGAEFAIYGSLADATAGTNSLRNSATSATGTLTFTGLRQSAFANGAVVAPTDPGFQYYWLVETKAPAGYELLSAPVRVTVGDADLTIDLQVSNSPANAGFTLPFTGSALSAGIFYGGGGAILLGALLLIVRSRRKAAEETA